MVSRAKRWWLKLMQAFFLEELKCTVWSTWKRAVSCLCGVCTEAPWYKVPGSGFLCRRRCRMEGVVGSLRCGKKKTERDVKKKLPLLQNNKVSFQNEDIPVTNWIFIVHFLPPVQRGGGGLLFCSALRAHSLFTFNLGGWARECRSMYAVQLCYQRKDYVLVWQRVEQIALMCWLSLIC